MSTLGELLRSGRVEKAAFKAVPKKLVVDLRGVTPMPVRLKVVNLMGRDLYYSLTNRHVAERNGIKFPKDSSLIFEPVERNFMLYVNHLIPKAKSLKNYVDPYTDDFELVVSLGS